MRKIMEYMALGKPIVQTEVIEGRYTAEEASLYARPDDQRDFAEKILYLLDHPEEAQKMGSIGKKRIYESSSPGDTKTKPGNGLSNPIFLKIPTPTPSPLGGGEGGEIWCFLYLISNLPFEKDECFFGTSTRLRLMPLPEIGLRLYRKVRAKIWKDPSFPGLGEGPWPFQRLCQNHQETGLLN